MKLETLDLQIRNQELNSSWCPDTTTQSLSDFDKSSTVSFDCTNSYHNNVCIWEKFCCMGHTIMNFLGPRMYTCVIYSKDKITIANDVCLLKGNQVISPVDFFQSSTNYFYREKLEEFVANIERRIEN